MIKGKGNSKEHSWIKIKTPQLRGEWIQFSHFHFLSIIQIFNDQNHHVMPLNLWNGIQASNFMKISYFFSTKFDKNVTFPNHDLLFQNILQAYNLLNDWNPVSSCQLIFYRLRHVLNVLNWTIRSEFMTLFVWIYYSSAIFTSPGLWENH